jgi:hypothetical protein
MGLESISNIRLRAIHQEKRLPHPTIIGKFNVSQNSMEL